MEGLFLFAGLFSVLLLLIPTGLLLGLLVAFALRTDPDDAGGRASALYLSMATFVALFTALAAMFSLASALVDLAAGDEERTERAVVENPEFDFEGEFGGEEGFDFEPAPEPLLPGSGSGVDDDRATNAAVASVIVLLVSGAILWFHLPRLDRVGAAHLAGTGAWRVRRAYRLVTCLTAVLIVLVTASLSLYGVYSLAAPGTSGVGDRGDAVEALVPIVVLLAGAAVIFRLHWDDEKAPTVTAAVAP